MIGGMAVVHMSENDVVKDIVAVLARVRQGSEIIIEQGSRPVAVIKPAQPAGRMISEVIAALEANGANAVLDEDFARDVAARINAHSETWNPPSWE